MFFKNLLNSLKIMRFQKKKKNGKKSYFYENIQQKKKSATLSHIVIFVSCESLASKV